MTRRLLALAATASLAAAGLVALPRLAVAADPVTLLVGATPQTRPFPDDIFTVVDGTQRTGKRVNLPTAGCDAQGRSLCDDLVLINTLDGFDLQPRVTIPFSGPVNLLSVTPDTVFVTGPGLPRAGLQQLVLDPVSNTVSGVLDAFLTPASTYSLVVTNGVKDLTGLPVVVPGGSSRSVPFTTMTGANTLDRARAALDDGTAYAASGIAADQRVDFSKTFPDRDGRFAAAQVTTITRRDQLSAAEPTVLTSGTVLNTAASATQLGFGSLLSPQYVDGQGVIASTPTGVPLSPPTSTRVGVTMMAGPPNPASCLQPVIFGPGFTRSKYDLFLSGDALAGRGTAVFATDPLGHAFGPNSQVAVTTGAGPAATTVTGSGFGRGKDLNGDDRINNSEGVGPTFRFRRDGTALVPDQPSPQALVGLRDGLIQTVIDNMTLLRALERGVDVNNDGSIDTCTGEGAVAYYGQSFGGIYGTMLSGADPRVRTSALNVPGGPVVDIARQGNFRNLLAEQLQANKPDLRNGGPGRDGFTESIPLRRDPRITDPTPGSAAIQDYFGRANWIERPGNPETYAPRLAAALTAGTKKALYQTAYTDGTVPNTTSGVLYRAGNLYDRVWVYRNDRTPTVNTNPHGFLLDPTVAGRNQAQQQIGDFVTSRGATVTDPDGAGLVWESPTQATVTTDYRAQLDCLHYPDPQTGADPTRTPNSPDCPDRSATVSRAQVAATPSASATPASTASPAATRSPSPGSTPSASAAPSSTASPSQQRLSYTALDSPRRVLDSRTGLGTSRGPKRGPVTLDLSGVVPDGAGSVALNVTALNASGRGFVVAHPGGSAQPQTSNLNVEAAIPGKRANTQANEVVVRLSAARTVTLTVDSTTLDLVVDVVGFFGTDPRGPGLEPVTPTRLLDSRTTSTPLRRGESIIDLTGTAAEGASTVALNVTVTRPSARGFVVAYPTGTSRPGTSNVNVEPGQTQANQVLVRVGAGNRVSLFVDSTSAALVADLVGVVVPAGGGFAPLSVPQRVADTRTGLGLPRGPLRGSAVLTLTDAPADVRAVVLNVTATNGDRAGFVTVYPNGQPQPGTSNVNFPTALTQANEVLTGVGAQRDVRVVVGGANGPAAHVVVDVVGYLYRR